MLSFAANGTKYKTNAEIANPKPNTHLYLNELKILVYLAPYFIAIIPAGICGIMYPQKYEEITFPFVDSI